jgi:LPXTG-site transpeptidase (sortase) family protein
MRVLECYTRAGGGALLVFCVLALASGELGRRADLAASERAPPDQRMWSRTRLQEYAASLQLSVSPPVARLQIVSIGLLVPVYPDTRELHLNRGAGLIPGMATPGEGGNLGIAGHRDGYFRALKGLHLNDSVVLDANGHRFFYKVSSIDVVPRTQTALLADTADPTMTLVTCFPFYYVGDAPQRFVARAVLERTVANGRRATNYTEDHRS